MRRGRLLYQRDYNQTPFGNELSEKERRERQALIPRGEVYPGTYGKRQTRVKTGYYVPPLPPLTTDGQQLASRDYAKLLIASIPASLTKAEKKEYWEHSLLAAYYRLYGDSWPHWQDLLPWVLRKNISVHAAKFGCENKWDWMDKQHLLKKNGIRWDLRELDYLIDRYPDRQVDGSVQTFYMDGRTFEEIVKLATLLNLPTRQTIQNLSNYAHGLNAAN